MVLHCYSVCENTITLLQSLNCLTNRRVMLISRNLCEKSVESKISEFSDCSVVVEHQVFEYYVKSISIIRELISQKNSCQADNEIVEITGIYSHSFLTKIFVKLNIGFSTNGEGKNRILDPKGKNSCPSGEATRARNFSLRG